MTRSIPANFLWTGLAAALIAVAPPILLAQIQTDTSQASRDADRTAGLPPITTAVSGTLSLPKNRPVALEFAGSPKLTALLERELSARGVRLAGAGAQDVVAVRVRGVLQLTGKLTARIRIAELAEKGTLVEPADGSRTLAPADVGYVIAAGDWLGHLVRTGRIGAPAGAFLLLDIIGQATGAKDGFNRAVGGDRRGICLINCENWNRTRQAAFHVVESQDGPATRRAEIRSELRAEALQPGRLISAGLAAVVDALAGGAAPTAASGTDHATPSD